MSNTFIRTSLFALLTAVLTSGGFARQPLDEMSDNKIAVLTQMLQQVEDPDAGDDRRQDAGGRFSALIDKLVQDPPNPNNGQANTRYADHIEDILNTTNISMTGGAEFADPPFISRLMAELLKEQLDGYHGGQPPAIPTHFPYIDANVHSPIPVTVQGTYLGVVEGLTNFNSTLSGTAQFDINAQGFNVNIGGQFDFGSKGVVHITQASANGPLGFHYNQQSFLGGNITSTDHTNFGFYGPQAQEFGGHWAFVVTGGSEPGLVSGQVKTAR